MAHDALCDASLKHALAKVGFIHAQRVASSLQGSVWNALLSTRRQPVAIKVTNRQLHNENAVVFQGHKVRVHENILKEAQILKYLTTQNKKAPICIVKFVEVFQSRHHFYLAMEHGGLSLHGFVVKAHAFIQAGNLDIAEWHKAVKIIFTQMIEAVEYIHSHNVCHFDISIENYLISDADVAISQDGKIRFKLDNKHNVQVKLCDFGLAERFEPTSDFQSSKFCGKSCYRSPEVVNKQAFNAKSNDIWCLGVCLFMLLVGGHPWHRAAHSDPRFCVFQKSDGLHQILTKWRRVHYVNDQFIGLIKDTLQSQKNRASLEQIKNKLSV